MQPTQSQHVSQHLSKMSASKSTTLVRQLAEEQRIALQAKLGTEMEQLTRQYAERVQTQMILSQMPPDSDSEPSSRASTAATPATPATPAPPLTKDLQKLRSDYFEEQIMLVEPQRELENSKVKHTQVITDMLLRILLISHEAIKAQLGWDDAKMNKVARTRLRQVLDFKEEHPASNGLVYDLEQNVPITAPLHVTIDYFNKLEYNSETNPVAPKLAAYFAVKYGITEAVPKTYAFDHKPSNPMEMEIKDILTLACDGLRSNLKKRIRAREKKFIGNNVLVGSDLYAMCWIKYTTPSLLEDTKNTGTAQDTAQHEAKNKPSTVNTTAAPQPYTLHQQHDENNGRPDITTLTKVPYNMKEQDIWRVLAVIGIRHPDIVDKEKEKQKKMERTEDDLVRESEEHAIAAAADATRFMDALAEAGYVDPTDLEGNKRRYEEKRTEQKLLHRAKIKQQRKEAKKQKRREEAEAAAAEGGASPTSLKKTKKSPQKMSRRKKLMLLKQAGDIERAKQQKILDNEFHAAHENSEGIEFKKKAYRPSKAAIMLKDNNFYNDARLSTRRPGSRNNVFEPSLEDTAYGRAKIATGEMKRRGTEFIFRQPKGHLKDLATFNLTLVRPPTKEQRRMLRAQRSKQASAAAAEAGATHSPPTPLKFKRPQSTDYQPILLYRKANESVDNNARLKKQRFGSLRNLDRAVNTSKQMLHAIQAIPTTAASLRHVPQTSSLQYAGSPKLRTLSDLHHMNEKAESSGAGSEAGDSFTRSHRMGNNMATLALDDLPEMEGALPPSFPVQEGEEGTGETGDTEGAVGGDIAGADQDEPLMYLGEDGEYYYAEDEDNGMYLGEDGEYYYDEDEDEDDADADADNATVQQLKDLQRQYESKLQQNSLSKLI